MGSLTMKDLKSIMKDFKYQNADAIRNMLFDALSGMYKWEGLPDTVRPEYLELYLRLYGQCAIVPYKGEYIAALLNRGGAPDAYGLGTTPIISTLNGYTETYNECINDIMYGEDGKRGVIIYNNNVKEPDTIVSTFTGLLAEAITSFYQNIIHSRFNPLFVVNNDVIKRAVEEKFADIMAGKPVIIASDNIIEEIEAGHKALEVVPITDVDKQEKIQFISKTIDDLLRWFLTIYGQAVQGNAKLAQQTVDEVNGTTSASFIIPEIGWRCRKRAADLMNATFGWNVTVTYNKPWAVEVEKYTEDVEEPEAPEGAEKIEEEDKENG